MSQKQVAKVGSSESSANEMASEQRTPQKVHQMVSPFKFHPNTQRLTSPRLPPRRFLQHLHHKLFPPRPPLRLHERRAPSKSEHCFGPKNNRRRHRCQRPSPTSRPASTPELARPVFAYQARCYGDVFPGFESASTKGGRGSVPRVEEVRDEGYCD